MKLKRITFISWSVLNMWNKTATSKTWTQTLDPDPEKPGPRKAWTLKNLGPEKTVVWKTWTLKNLDPEKPGLWKTSTMKNAGNSKKKKKRLEDHMVWFINTEILLRKDL